MNSLKNKTALITGSARGLGKAIAERYAALGANIVLNYSKLFSINTKGAYFTMQQAALNVADKGRIIYIASSTTAFPVAGMAVYGGGKMTPRYLVGVLSKEIGHRGVTVNSIIPIAVDHSGIFAESGSYPELRKFLLDSCPMGRLAEVEDVANAAEFFASDLSPFVNGQHLLVNRWANQ